MAYGDSYAVLRGAQGTSSSLAVPADTSLEHLAVWITDVYVDLPSELLFADIPERLAVQRPLGEVQGGGAQWYGAIPAGSIGLPDPFEAVLLYVMRLGAAYLVTYGFTLTQRASTDLAAPATVVVGDMRPLDNLEELRSCFLHHLEDIENQAIRWIHQQAPGLLTQRGLAFTPTHSMRIRHAATARPVDICPDVATWRDVLSLPRLDHHALACSSSLSDTYMTPGLAPRNDAGFIVRTYLVRETPCPFDLPDVSTPIEECVLGSHSLAIPFTAMHASMHYLAAHAASSAALNDMIARTASTVARVYATLGGASRSRHRLRTWEDYRARLAAMALLSEQVLLTLPVRVLPPSSDQGRWHPLRGGKEPYDTLPVGGSTHVIPSIERALALLDAAISRQIDRMQYQIAAASALIAVVALALSMLLR